MTKLKIETFSGPDVPQFPVKEMAKDTIEVKHAKDGSGEVTFMYGGEYVTSMSGKDRADASRSCRTQSRASPPDSQRTTRTAI